MKGGGCSIAVINPISRKNLVSFILSINREGNRNRLGPSGFFCAFQPFCDIYDFCPVLLFSPDNSFGPLGDITSGGFFIFFVYGTCIHYKLCFNIEYLINSKDRRNYNENKDG